MSLNRAGNEPNSVLQTPYITIGSTVIPLGESRSTLSGNITLSGNTVLSGTATSSSNPVLNIKSTANGNAFIINSPGGGTPNFIVNGAGEQTFRLYNNATTGSTRTSIKLASRLNSDWEWIAYTDSTSLGVNDLTIANLAGTALSIGADRSVTFPGVLTASGGTTINTSTTITGGTSTSSALTITNANTYGGAGYAGHITLTNTTGGATNPNKYIRTNSIGGLEIVNSAYNAVIFSLTDAGVINALGVAAGTTTTAAQIGYMGLPQSGGTGKTGAYSIAATDNGQHIYYTTSGQTVTIPANTSVALPVGFSCVIINAAAVTTTIAITTDTLLMAGTGTGGAGVSRTLAAYGMATLVKITATSWMISGAGLT